MFTSNLDSIARSVDMIGQIKSSTTLLNKKNVPRGDGKRKLSFELLPKSDSRKG